jgi:hypothetical protein
MPHFRLSQSTLSAHVLMMAVSRNLASMVPPFCIAFLHLTYFSESLLSYVSPILDRESGSFFLPSVVPIELLVTTSSTSQWR